jgi:hypothetical protein
MLQTLMWKELNVMMLVDVAVSKAFVTATTTANATG